MGSVRLTCRAGSGTGRTSQARLPSLLLQDCWHRFVDKLAVYIPRYSEEWWPSTMDRRGVICNTVYLLAVSKGTVGTGGTVSTVSTVHKQHQVFIAWRPLTLGLHVWSTGTYIQAPASSNQSATITRPTLLLELSCRQLVRLSTLRYACGGSFNRLLCTIQIVGQSSQSSQSINQLSVNEPPPRINQQPTRPTHYNPTIHPAKPQR